jgi:hypothetical protein
MDLQTVLRLVGEHYEHAKLFHPNPKDLEQWIDHIEARLQDVKLATEAHDVPDAHLIAGKRALQVAGMAIRMIEDLGLGLVIPTYDAGLIKHMKS